MEIIASTLITGLLLLKVNSDNGKITTKIFNDNQERDKKMDATFDKFSRSLDSFNETLTKIDQRLEKVEEKQKGE